MKNVLPNLNHLKEFDDVIIKSFMWPSHVLLLTNHVILKLE